MKKIEDYLLGNVIALARDVTDDESHDEDEDANVKDGNSKEKEITKEPNFPEKFLPDTLLDDEQEADASGPTQRIPQNSTRQPRRMQTRSTASKTAPNPLEKNTLSESAVEILTNPELLSQLEMFQNPRGGQIEDTMLLTDPRVLQALRDFNGIYVDPNAENTQPLIVGQEQSSKEKPIQIKREDGKGVKRKVEKGDDFKSLWTSTGKKKKKTSTGGCAVTAGASPKGKISTRDASEEKMKDLIDSKIANIRAGDVLLQKTSNVGNQPQKVFSQVSDTNNICIPHVPDISHCQIIFLYSITF